MVAGGGGTANGGVPGAAGGLNGYNNGSNTTMGGTQTAGGAGSSADRNGRFGYAYGGTVAVMVIMLVEALVLQRVLEEVHHLFLDTMDAMRLVSLQPRLI